MSCRTTTLGSLSTSFIRERFNLKDGQCTSLLHELKKTAKTNQLTTTPEDFIYALNSIEREIDIFIPSGGVKNRLLRKIEQVRQDGMPEDPFLATAAVEMRLRAERALREVETQLYFESNRLRIPHSRMKSIFDEEYDNTPSPLPEDVPELLHPLPNDKGTRWALHYLRNGYKCRNCGQFATHIKPHECPNPPVFEPQYQKNTDNTLWTENFEAFQHLYEQVKEEINAGSTHAPVFPAMENTPGALTGGIAAPQTGITFGLELEIDFPYDDYPYNLREEFARQLYEEGIVMSPDVNRWHYVGNEYADRPGGVFIQTPNDWSCESDSSIDDVEGHRGVEIKSQILYDEPRTWYNIRRICEVARNLGGQPTPRCGLHVNVSSDGFPDDDPEKHTRLLKLVSAYDDTIIRLSHNPDSGPSHRGRRYCAPVSVPPQGFRSVEEAKVWAGHYNGVNLEHMQSENSEKTSTSRIEARIFDASLDPGRIQGQVALTLGLVSAAKNGIEPLQESEPAGTHRRVFGTSKLSGEEWEKSTEAFRQLVDILSTQNLNTKEHKRMFTWLFARTRWQSGN